MPRQVDGVLARAAAQLQDPVARRERRPQPPLQRAPQ